MAKLRVALLFGGVSSEHEISCISAAAAADNLREDLYDVVKIGITKKGRWLHYPGGTDKMRDGSWSTFPDCAPAFISPDRTTHGIVTNHDGRFDTIKIDVAYPVLHGRNGEDGTVQGLLQLAGIPYVGCGVLASALCMDKAFANEMFRAAGIPHTPWITVHRYELDDYEVIQQTVEAQLRFPVFVKPAVGGSSVGVVKAKRPGDLRDALKSAAAHDSKLVIEQGVAGREVECAVIGNGPAVHSTLPGEIESCNEVYDYEAKYHSDGASKLYMPARLPEQKLRQIQAMAESAFLALGCAGLARVDFFVQEDGVVLLNEINTLPGFTTISMYPKLMEEEGLGFSDLNDRLIRLALEGAEHE